MKKLEREKIDFNYIPAGIVAEELSIFVSAISKKRKFTLILEICQAIFNCFRWIAKFY